MIIVDRNRFLALPAGTLFAKFEPCVFGEVQIKADTCGGDSICNSLIPWFEGNHDSGDYFDVIERMMAGESSPVLDYDSYGRDGVFEEEQLFAVFEPKDVGALMQHLMEALSPPDITAQVTARNASAKAGSGPR